MRVNNFEPGNWNAICDVCGMKFKADDLRDRWDGLKTCKDDWEMRHPQELIRPMPTERAVPWTRPESKDQFISMTYDPSVLNVPSN